MSQCTCNFSYFKPNANEWRYLLPHTLNNFSILLMFFTGWLELGFILWNLACISAYMFQLFNSTMATTGFRNPAGIYLFKFNSGNTCAICEICSQLTKKTPERRHWRLSGVLIVNFEQISHIVQVFPFLNMNNCFHVSKFKWIN